MFDNDILETGIWRVGCNPKVLAAPQLPAALSDTRGTTILLVQCWLLRAIASSSLLADAALSDPEQTQSDFFCFFLPS